MENKDTLPRLLKRNYDKWGADRAAMRHKDLGIWYEFTWQEYYENVKSFALGLKSIGFERGDKVCIIGDNEPQWYWAEIAIQALGGISVGIFVDCIPDEVKYLVAHAEAIFVVARDQEQVDKILQIREKIPLVKRVIYWDSKGMWSYHDPFITSYKDIQKLGEEYDSAHPDFFEDSIKKAKDDDIAIISYTSGTTGLPKGAMISHKNLVSAVSQWFEVEPWKSTDNYLSYVAPAWITEQAFGITGTLLAGATVNFLERPETLENDVREIGPSMILYNSRMWEALCSSIQTKIADGSFWDKFLFKWGLKIGYKVVGLELAHKKVNFGMKSLYKLADILIFHSLRDRIGLKHTRAPYTGGSLISPGTFRFFWAIGVKLREIYGGSEAGLCSAHRPDNIKFETIGQPLPGMKVKLTQEGEMLWKGDCIFQGYYKDPEKTATTLVDGWYHSGDAGHIDDDGHIVYLDRVVDLMELEGGKKYSPQHIEGSLKFSPYIRDVIAIGGKNLSFVTALVQIDFESVGRWAEKRNIPYTTFADLSQKPEVYDLVESDMNDLNKNLPAVTQVKKFVCLHKELDADEEELTRTRKVRRDFLMKKYAELVEAIKVGKKTFLSTSEIKYRDGSRGETSTSVSIRTLF